MMQLLILKLTNIINSSLIIWYKDDEKAPEVVFLVVIHVKLFPHLDILRPKEKLS